MLLYNQYSLLRTRRDDPCFCTCSTNLKGTLPHCFQHFVLLPTQHQQMLPTVAKNQMLYSQTMGLKMVLSLGVESPPAWNLPSHQWGFSHFLLEQEQEQEHALGSNPHQDKLQFINQQINLFRWHKSIIDRINWWNSEIEHWIILLKPRSCIHLHKGGHTSMSSVVCLNLHNFCYPKEVVKTNIQ